MESRTLTAHFADRRQAGAAASRLQALRAQDVHVSESVHSSEAYTSGLQTNGEWHAPGSSDILPGSTLAEDYLLSAVVQADIHHKALRIVEDNGGWI
ncbi:hypothetical protein [Gorillibacterium massiliense]|uniref:hypothetical protein n=1 Tax=Gorillibacterium massiliense TaxID=1280390 RepID=UPI0004B5B053|nr:hypothetical protein [Gorillibacterium massiliense]